jgi:AcrR family transcriptional regulator
MMAVAPQDGERRSRDAASTRLAILDSARECFTISGYEQVGVREIAQKAGVTGALINRYFGSKEALFGEVLNSREGIEAGRETSWLSLLDDRARFGERLARRIVERRDDRSRFDPMLVILRSVGQPAAEAVLRDRLTSWLAPLVTELGGPDAEIMAEMILATLAGFDLLRNVIKSSALASCEEERLVKLLGTVLQAHLPAYPANSVASIA